MCLKVIHEYQSTKHAKVRSLSQHHYLTHNQAGLVRILKCTMEVIVFLVHMSCIDFKYIQYAQTHAIYSSSNHRSGKKSTNGLISYSLCCLMIEEKLNEMHDVCR